MVDTSIIVDRAAEDRDSSWMPQSARGTPAVYDQFGRIRRQLNRLATQELRPLGLGLQQALIVRMLADQGSSTSSEVAHTLLLDPAAVARAADGLERRCLLKRHASRKDRRQIELSLTEAGSLMSAVISNVLDRIAAAFAAPLSDEEQSLLSALQEKILVATAQQV